MELRKPKPKQRNRKQFNPLLPIIKTSGNKIYIFSGIFDGLSVVIKDQKDIEKLTRMGCFGTRCPDRNRASPDTIPQVFNDEKSGKEGAKSLIYVNNTLNLFLEEAFFLLYSVKCLNIYYLNKLQTEQEVWKLFCNTDKFFMQNYAVYHHYRTKNWVVKAGMKYGGDFVLYKAGVSFYHASYVIIIDVLDNETTERRNDLFRRSMEVANVSGLNRLCETVGKELLICQLMWPSNLTTLQVNDLLQFKVNETIMKRWIPSQTRDT